MSTLLFVASSLSGPASQSRLIAAELVEAWRRAHPAGAVIERNLAADPVPHLSQETFAAAVTPAEQRSPAQHRAAALADTLIDEVERASLIVLAVPMYNFSIPSTLKAWLDHIARAGRTFRYGASGPEGMLQGRKVVVVTGRGGVYSTGPAKAFDFQEPYLRTILGFIGLTDVEFVHVEGLKMGPEAAAGALERARGAIGAVLQARAAA